MRLLYVIDSLAPGGAETSLVEMAPGLITRGIDLHVLPLGRRRDLGGALAESGARIHDVPAARGRGDAIRAVMETCRTVRPDLVHTTLFEADLAGRIGARLAGVPASSSLVNDSYDATHKREAGRLRLATAQFADAATSRLVARFHSISAAVATSVGPRLGIPPDKIDVIPRGRDPKRFPLRSVESRNLARHDLGLAPATPVILAVGRQEPQKGLEHLIAAASRVSYSNPGLVVLIAGREGRASAELRAAARATTVEVRFLGHRTDIALLMAGADLFCFPSEREGFGGVLIEALAVGVPIVASKIPTTLEVLAASPDVARLSDAGDVQSLALAIEDAFAEIHRDPAQAGQRALRGRALFDDFYSIESVASRMADFLLAAGGRCSRNRSSARPGARSSIARGK